MKIALDAMGGDFGPAVVVEGAVAAASEFGLSSVLVGDRVRCYAEVARVGRTSMTVKIETWVSRLGVPGMMKVTEGVFTYVAIDSNRQPRPVDL